MSATMLKCASPATVQNGSPDSVEGKFSSEISTLKVLNDFIFRVAIMPENHNSKISSVIDQFPNKDALVAHVHFKVASSQEVTNRVQTHLAEL